MTGRHYDLPAQPTAEAILAALPKLAPPACDAVVLTEQVSDFPFREELPAELRPRLPTAVTRGKPGKAMLLCVYTMAWVFVSLVACRAPPWTDRQADAVRCTAEQRLLPGVDPQNRQLPLAR